MMLTVWGRPNSSNVKKVLWTLEELGLEYENIKVGGPFGGNKDEKYLALNPNGLVPTLQDDDFTLWESNTIVRYLSAQYGLNQLYIADAKKRAQAEKWMDWVVSAFSKSFLPILQHTVRFPEDQRDPIILKNAVQQFEDSLRILDKKLSKNVWLSGEYFGIGDISVGVFIYYYYELKLSNENKFPHVENWYKRLSERAGYRKTVMTPIT